MSQSSLSEQSGQGVPSQNELLQPSPWGKRFRHSSKVRGKYGAKEKIGRFDGHYSYGTVFKAKHRKSDKLVIVMKVYTREKGGCSSTVLEELKNLQKLQQKNIVRVLEICGLKATAPNCYTGIINPVFEFCEHDLASLLDNFNVRISNGEIKGVIRQLFRGLRYIHNKGIIIRDMEASNVLFTRAGVLKLANIGLARVFGLPIKADQPNGYENQVETLWFRPPELLLGERNYGPAIDLWSAGCIMAQMWTRYPIMQGKTEQQQLTLISHFCGSITPEVWPGLEELVPSSSLQLPRGLERKGRDGLRRYVNDNRALDLVDKLLTLDPKSRIKADQALKHGFFCSDPMPTNLPKVLSTRNQTMLEYLTSRPLI